MSTHHVANRFTDRATFFGAVAVLTACFLLLAAVAAAAPAFAAGGTYVRFAQLGKGAVDADLMLTSASDPEHSVTIPALEYGQLSAYRLIQPGDYVLGLAAKKPQPGAAAISMPFNVAPGHSYTVAGVDPAGSPSGLIVLTDDPGPATPDAAKLRVIDGAPAPEPLDVRGSGGDIALGLRYGAASEYRTLPPGPTQLTVGAPDGKTVELRVDPQPNQVLSVTLVDRGGDLAAEVWVDAEGPTRVPPGAIDAGSGGTATQPGTTTASITLGALAVLAAVLAVALARRTGSARARA